MPPKDGMFLPQISNKTIIPPDFCQKRSWNFRRFSGRTLIDPTSVKKINFGYCYLVESVVY